MAEAVEQIYRYQPTDEDGRPIGGLQVIKYTTPDELSKKLTEQNILLIRKLRQETKKVRLGITEEETLPDNIQRFDGPIEFAPRDLSEDERYDISRRLLDPTTAADATTQLMEARLGVPLDKLGTTLRSVQQDNINLRAKIEANAFVADNPDYYRCAENFEAIASWIARYNLAPVKENFQKAYDTLKAQGIMINGAAVAPEPVVVQTPVVMSVEPVEPQRVEIPVIEPVRISSGLNRQNSSDTGTIIPTGSDIEYTYEVQIGGDKKNPIMKKITLTGLAAINAMPSEEYKRRLVTDRDFGKKVEKLEAETRKPRQ